MEADSCEDVAEAGPGVMRKKLPGRQYLNSKSLLAMASNLANESKLDRQCERYKKLLTMLLTKGLRWMRLKRKRTSRVERQGAARCVKFGHAR